jgi:hypothetical protein
MGEVYAGDPRYVAGYQGPYHFLLFFLNLICFELRNLTLNVQVL